MLAGGTNRRVSNRGAVGMHQHYCETPAYLPAIWAEEGIQQGQGQEMEFLIDMGVDPSIMLYSLNTPTDEICVLVEKELINSRLATETMKKSRSARRTAASPLRAVGYGPRRAIPRESDQAIRWCGLQVV